MTSDSEPLSHPSSERRFLLIVTLGYSLLLVYGSLYPLGGWQWPAAVPHKMLWFQWPKYFSKSDIITNVLVYIPLGMLIARSLKDRCSRLSVILLATVLGTCLSLLLEFMQQFLPGRVASIADILLNSIGTLAGATITIYLKTDTRLSRKLLFLRNRYFNIEPLTNIGLIVLVLWALSQLIPLLPSFDMANLRQGVAPLWRALSTPALFSFAGWAAYTLNIAALGLLFSTLLRNPGRTLPLFAIFAILVLLLKVPIVSRQLSLEGTVGMMTGIMLLAFLRHLKTPVAGAITLSIVLAYILRAFQTMGPMLGTGMQPMNWIPLRSHMGTITGMIDIMDTLWPFAVLAYVTLLKKPSNHRSVAILGGIMIFSLTFGIEWIQQYFPGRHPDITDPIMATGGWTLVWLYYFAKRQKPALEIARR